MTVTPFTNPADQSSPTASAIIVAAGASSRMAGVDKIFAPLRGVPLIVRTIDAFERCTLVSAIVLVVADGPGLWDAARLVQEQEGWRKVRTVKAGGPRRQDSVALGLESLPPCDWVIVHDGARPLVGPGLIELGLEAAAVTGAAIAGVPAKDTVKVVGHDGHVVATPDRRGLWMVQTPQVFRRDLLERAHREVTEDVTDDAAMVERLGLPVRVFMGSYSNIKVTTPEDLKVAEALLADATPEQGAS
jgi:2-C-methyl-D-erythritol 4-phosphate cytidylyltransferase